MISEHSITDRIDAVTKIPLSHRDTTIPAPKSCKIEITANCNYNCAFCVRSIREISGEMDRQFYSRILRELADAGVEELGVFYIGESFTCRWLPDAIREAKQYFPYVFLTTNGSAATPERVKQCLDAGLDSLKFSINFYDSKQLGSVAGVNEKYWSKAIENLRTARFIRDEGFTCGIYASSIAFDGEQGEAMRQVVDSIKPFVDEHYWLPLYGMGGAKTEWQPKQGNPGRLGNMRDPLPCWAVFTEAHITADGKLAACCFGTGADGDLVMADLNEVDFMTGWNSLAYQQLRKAHLDQDVAGTACQGCIC